MTQRDTQNVMVTSLLAGIAGATLGILFAPRSGKETRERMGAVAADAKQRAKRELETKRERLGEKLSSTKDRMSDAVSSKVQRGKRGTDTEESPIITAWNEEV